MKIIGLMSWFDEKDDYLMTAIHTYRPLLDHLIALDGRYPLFKADRDYSPATNVAAICSVCDKEDLPFTIGRTPPIPEVEKRSLLFRMGEAITDEDDWYLVIDADEGLVQYPDDFREQLETTNDLAVEVGYSQTKLGRAPVGDGHVRKLFKAIRGLEVRKNHYTYCAQDTVLWGVGWHKPKPVVPLDWTKKFIVAHRTNERDKGRNEAAWDYYDERDHCGLEMGKCSFDGCDEQAMEWAYQDWRIYDLCHSCGAKLNGLKQCWRCGAREGLTADIVDVCSKHKKELLAKGDRQITLLGFDKNDLRMRPEPARNHK